MDETVFRPPEADRTALDSPADQTRWIRSLRGPKNRLDPSRPYAVLRESEPDDGGRMRDVATVFLANRECPWTCVMCDLWRDTLDAPLAPGQAAGQVERALEELGPADWIKIYNAGSFFDDGAIPPEDRARIARNCRAFERAIVECHPSLVRADRVPRFRDGLNGTLEIAMGLETAHPPTLAKLNKGMTPADFSDAARFIAAEGMSLRAFLLVNPPFMTPDESLEWGRRSIDFAFECGAGVCALIPTRSGNGAMDELEKSGRFFPPGLDAVEALFEYGLSLGKGRVFVDLWNSRLLEKDAGENGAARVKRLAAMNRSQTVEPEAPASRSGSIFRLGPENGMNRPAGP